MYRCTAPAISYLRSVTSSNTASPILRLSSSASTGLFISTPTSSRILLGSRSSGAFMRSTWRGSMNPSSISSRARTVAATVPTTCVMIQSWVSLALRCCRPASLTSLTTSTTACFVAPPMRRARPAIWPISTSLCFLSMRTTMSTPLTSMPSWRAFEEARTAIPSFSSNSFSAARLSRMFIMGEPCRNITLVSRGSHAPATLAKRVALLLRL
mmetsp:Transcript_231/g.484  ORF Transcript_231/g.484 Transcript_231/m.484 type:complete len:212 (+) Transcript_231:1245-1880(+)